MAVFLAALPWFAAGFWLGRSTIAGAWLVGVGVLAGLPWLFVTLYYTHLLDFPLYYSWRAFVLTDFAVALAGLPIGMALARAKSSPAERFIAVFFGVACTIAAVAVAFAKPMWLSLPSDAVTERWNGDVCMQSTASTCGPCAAATVLRALGDSDVGEAVLAREARSTRTGTLNWLLLRAIERRGFTATFEEPATLAEVHAPAVIGVAFGSIGHFLAYLGPGTRGVLIGEPLRGLRDLTEEEFAGEYTFSHFALEVRRPR